MKTTTVIFVILAILYLVIGGVAVIFYSYNTQVYFNSFAVIAGTASILGLIAFIIPKLSKKDIEQVGIEYLKEVIEASEELKTREAELISKQRALTTKEKEIRELEIKKQEMEILVRKASMTLFLQDQYERNKLRIEEIVNDNKELKKNIKEIIELKEKLLALGMEIQSDPNMDILNDVIAGSKVTKQYDGRGSMVTLFEIMAAIFLKR